MSSTVVEKKKPNNPQTHFITEDAKQMFDKCFCPFNSRLRLHQFWDDLILIFLKPEEKSGIKPLLVLMFSPDYLVI